MSNTPNIFVIDDDVSTLEIILVILRNAGYNVEVSTHGEPEFFNGRIHPDLILLDNNLGKKTGADICKELKATKHTAHIPIILISAMDDISKIASDACADDHIAKPFSMQLLLDKIRSALGEK